MTIEVEYGPELRQYGRQATVAFKLSSQGGDGFCPRAGDVRIRKDHGDWQQATNSPVSHGSNVFTLRLTDVEMQAAQVAIHVIDQKKFGADEAFTDRAIFIQTFGHAAAHYPGTDV